MIKALVVDRGLCYLAKYPVKGVQRKPRKRHRKVNPGAVGVRRGKGGKRADRSREQIAHLPVS